MENCLQCLKPLIHVPGRKQKSFCDVNCRNKYFYAQRKKQVEDAKALLVSLPADYVEVKNVAILTKEGEIKPIFPKPSKKRKKESIGGLGNSVEFKPMGSNEAYDSPRLPKNIQDEPIFSKPLSLDELKKLCPPELTGFDRSHWISTERQKYGI